MTVLILWLVFGVPLGVIAGRLAYRNEVEDSSLPDFGLAWFLAIFSFIGMVALWPIALVGVMVVLAFRWIGRTKAVRAVWSFLDHLTDRWGLS